MSDFIDVVDDVLEPAFCQEIVQRFKDSKAQQHAGKTGAGVDTSKKRSTDIDITGHADWQDVVQRLLDKTYPALEDYIRRHRFMLIGAVSPTVRDPDNGQAVTLNNDNFDRLGEPNLRALIGTMYRYGTINAQMYERNAGGYPHWHSEIYPQDQRCEPLHRVLLWMFYLNDIKEGGETEFFYQQKKIEARAGRMVIAPAGFTHTHRGNMPRSSDKYIVTSWVMFHRAEQLYGKGQ
jgi:hypothetical protein